jgi:ABC-type dipeptide/oligopeptide/nickel transport system permease component
VALAILSVVVFILARATGDPLHMILPMSATEEDYANARRYLGLDRPYVEQYFSSPAISGRRSAPAGR